MSRSEKFLNEALVALRWITYPQAVDSDPTGSQTFDLVSNILTITPLNYFVVPNNFWIYKIVTT